MDKQIDAVFTFDTTGSMYPCLTQVRRSLASVVEKLFKTLPGIRIGIIVHGDYRDGPSVGTYLTRHLDLTDDQKAIVRFINEVPATHGAGPHAVYEQALGVARSFSWRLNAQKVVTVIGDEPPHDKKFPDGRWTNDPNEEIKLLVEAGVKLYGVQAFGNRYATPFYQSLATKSGGYYLKLDQLAAMVEMIQAICFQQEPEEEKRKELLSMFESELVQQGRLDRSVRNAIHTFLGKAPRPSIGGTGNTSLDAVPPWRFQILRVGNKDATIQDFVVDNGLTFSKGRGFYQFTKTETIQENKEVVLRDKTTGDMFTGPKAREMVGVPYGIRDRLKPAALGQYDIFVQSTSVNRRLKANTLFLYEVDPS